MCHLMKSFLRHYKSSSKNKILRKPLDGSYKNYEISSYPQSKKKKLFVETPINVCLYRRLTGILPTKYFFFFFNYIFEITSNVRKSLYYLNKTFQGSNS